MPPGVAISGVTRRTLRYVLGCVLAGTAASAVVLSAQRWTREGDVEPNPSYDGRYAFARLRYADHPGDACTCPVPGSRGLVGWQHTYPHADRDLMRITMDMTSLDGRADSSVVVAADDPQLMKYPIVYLSEPACWAPSESEVKALRTYLLKGGFLIVDDFTICSGGSVRNQMSRRVFEHQMRRVLPDGKLVPIDMSDPVVNEFFALDASRMEEALTMPGSLPPQIYGIYDRNDPGRRLMVAANYNTALHSFWDWQHFGWTSVEGKNEAYKLGVNYLMYGFTH